jgi:hypothetical protein
MEKRSEVHMLSYYFDALVIMIVRRGGIARPSSTMIVCGILW